MNFKLKLGILAATLATTAGAAMAQEKTYEVAVIRWDPADIYFNGVQFGQDLERQRIEKEDGVKIEFRVTGANDVSAQRNGLDAQIARGVDGVLLVPWRGEAMRGIVADLREEGIPVVTSNAWVPDAPQTFVAFDNSEAGRLGGEAIVRRLDELRGKDWPTKGGVIVELRCIITASFDIGRHEGYRSVFDPIAAEYPNVKIEEREAGCDGGDARKAVDDLISRYGGENILAVASIDGTMGIGGAVPAFEAQGLLHPLDDPRHIPIATVDGTVPELQAVARGDIDHVSVQPAIGEGVMSMRLLYQMMKSGKMLETPGEAATIMADSDELWAPVAIEPSGVFDGAWYRTTAYSIPGDVSHDDPRVWSTKVYERDNGKLPAFTE
ncbi:sugar ABC transporter substrate-binding protein [Pelagibius litoralis]|uniref:Sugar ABC transporter substrate-binding protein n=1 Tax=Pelagibius litoralis TaxID=374515 RepID=A0A967EYG7_9PROT|nr:sugar ABC transporter substrate-binding protein [Pelagibius litoralis]NIA69684.1 sugar ABC transporter substrate-binding protein [Pelagibius litoralis]